MRGQESRIIPAAPPCGKPGARNSRTPYNKGRDGKTKNDHFRGLLAAAQARGFRPECFLFDSWYAGPEDLKAVRSSGWRFLGRLTGNRRLRLGGAEPRRVDELPISAAGARAWLPGFGAVTVFRVVARDGDTEHRITNDLAMGELERQALAERSWAIEEYHRGLKPHCGAERCQMRHARAQRDHIGCAIRAFVRREWHRYTTGVSWFEAKGRIIRDSVRAYLARPWYLLPKTATA